MALTSITGPTEQLGISLSSTKTVNCLHLLKFNTQQSYPTNLPKIPKANKVSEKGLFLRAPMVLGHEAAGVVAKLGSNVTNLKVLSYRPKEGKEIFYEI